MKATARHLPVEGELKSGEKVLDTQTGQIYTIMTVGESEVVVEPEGYSFPIGDAKPVKLFAGTQDIEEGDKVWDEVHNRFDKVILHFGNLRGKISVEVFNKGNGILIGKEHLYKILGELSPNATWVENEDKIEIRKHFYAVMIDFPNDKKVSPEDYSFYYEVKCPTCSTYH